MTTSHEHASPMSVVPDFGPLEEPPVASRPVTHTSSVNGVPATVEDFSATPRGAPVVPRTGSRRLSVRKPPSMGFPSLLYKFNCLIGRPEWVPRMSKKEQEERARQAEANRRKSARNRATAELLSHTYVVPQLTFVLMNVKGGAGKTTVTVYLSSIMGQLTHRSVLVIDANPASGTSARRLGKEDGETLTIRGLDGAAENIDGYNSFIRLTPPTPYGVRVVASDPIISANEHLEGRRFTELVSLSEKNSEYVLLDTGNDITSQVCLAAVEKSKVLVFVANAAIGDSLRQLATTMETMRKHGHGDKVDNAVVVISNIPSGKRLDEYRKFVHRVNNSDEVVEELSFKGVIVGVPHDPVIAPDQEVQLDILDFSTYQAFLEAANAVLSRAEGMSQSPTPVVQIASPDRYEQ